MVETTAKDVSNDVLRGVEVFPRSMMLFASHVPPKIRMFHRFVSPDTSLQMCVDAAQIDVQFVLE
jgi:hypothetical protein